MKFTLTLLILGVTATVFAASSSLDASATVVQVDSVVEDEPQQRVDAAPERHFFVFEQTKYALDGRTSFAIIGGIIERDESAETAARREVTEEMNGMVECREYVFLGRYRTDVNRGMGWLHSFLATNCTRTNKAATNNTIHDIASSSSASLLRNRGNEKTMKVKMTLWVSLIPNHNI